MANTCLLIFIVLTIILLATNLTNVVWTSVLILQDVTESPTTNTTSSCFHKPDCPLWEIEGVSQVALGTVIIELTMVSILVSFFTRPKCGPAPELDTERNNKVRNPSGRSCKYLWVSNLTILWIMSSFLSIMILLPQVTPNNQKNGIVNYILYCLATALFVVRNLLLLWLCFLFNQLKIEPKDNAKPPQCTPLFSVLLGVLWLLDIIYSIILLVTNYAGNSNWSLGFLTTILYLLLGIAYKISISTAMFSKGRHLVEDFVVPHVAVPVFPVAKEEAYSFLYD